MKIISIVPQDNGKNFDSKETIATRQLIAFKDGEFKVLVTARWYMGRSSSASTVYCSVWITGHALPEFTDWTGCAGNGSAGGGGYCKQSAAFYEAISKAGIKVDTEISGRGMSVVDDFLEALALNAGFEHNYIARG